MCLMSSSKGIDIWLEIGERLRGVSHHAFPGSVYSCAFSPQNIFLKWDFKVHIRPLSLYRPQRVDIDHFG
ncbi:hypothetical protein T08_10722 [Trichinella sp. T8]|nr:hypothetical protein T08_10722 [Trichinella sp. T8]